MHFLFTIHIIIISNVTNLGSKFKLSFIKIIIIYIGQVFGIFYRAVLFLFSLRYRWFSGIDEDGKPGIQQGVCHNIDNSKIRESDKYTNM